MQRREVLKHGIVGEMGTITLSRCSGDGDGSGGNGNGSSGDSEFEQESAGSVGSNAIDQLAIVGWQSEVAAGRFSVDPTVENSGDQQTDAGEYTYRIQPSDVEGNEIETSGFTESYPGETEMSPGDTGTVKVSPSMEADPESVDT